MLDVLGTVDCADAIGGPGVQGGSRLQKLVLEMGLSQPAEVDHQHGHACPLANSTLAAVTSFVDSVLGQRPR